MTFRLHGAVSRECLRDICAFVRESGITPPRLSRLPGPIGHSRFPIVIFEFDDLASATMFRMKYDVSVTTDEKIEQIEAHRRERIEAGIKSMDLPPDLEEITREALIHGRRPEFPAPLAIP